MRGNPERMAIRTKLLEVYAKRRDTKGFELLATQLYSLTQGQGEDWAKAQELGMQIDPENPLYQPGGAPAGGAAAAGQMVEALGASTMPQSVLPSPSKFNASIIDSILRPAAPMWIWTSTSAGPRRDRLNRTAAQHAELVACRICWQLDGLRCADDDLTLPDIAPPAPAAMPAASPASSSISPASPLRSRSSGRRRSRVVQRADHRALGIRRIRAAGLRRGRNRRLRCRASSNWPRSSARSATWKVLVICCRKWCPRPGLAEVQGPGHA